MTKLFLVLTILSIAGLGCDSGSTGMAGSGGMGGSGGLGGAGPKCTTPQEMLRCDKVVNIAHRGAKLVRPEHTFLAHDKALEDGADILELDIRETIDGMLVVIHDGKVDRTTNCTGQVSQMTFADLRECDAGYNFSPDDGVTYPYRGMELVVPTLEEILQRYPNTAFVIELKQEDPSIVDNFVAVVREEGATDKITGSSEEQAVLDELRVAAPEIATNLSLKEVLEFWGKAAEEFDPEYEPPGEFLQVPVERGGIVVLHPGFVPRAHELGMYVQIFTINDEDEMRRLIEEEDVDGIMTDDPALLSKVIDELGVGD